MSLPPTLAVVVGLAAEARIARRLGYPVAIGGGTNAGAEVAARRIAQAGATGLISFGLAGGLDPGLRPGTIVVATVVLWQPGLHEAVRGDDETAHASGITPAARRFPTDAALSTGLGGATGHAVLAADTIVTRADTKRVLWQTTGAAAVDLESGAVARVATEHGLPFAVLRAICDPAERDLPPAALIALDRHGTIGLARVIGSVLTHPAQLPALLALAADAAAARRSLRTAVTRIRTRA
jgi:adenosylhomocysteine nucleosidase